jgi:coniferyl-aldehyde dehydrogenase
MQYPSSQIPLNPSHSVLSFHDVTELLKVQKMAFRDSPFPTENDRKQQLVALKNSLIKHQDKLLKAASADFGHRSSDETLLADIMPTIMSIDHAIKHLREWMKSEKREVSLLFQPAQNRVVLQPLGVVGIMSPWNYPIFLSIGPLVAAIAAGNRALIKPSEFTPYTNRILNEIIGEAFSRDEVAMVEGDAQLAADFSGLPFDHLLFTGSTEVGRRVMQAASNNLTPVTLELGGKSPALIASDVTADFAVERIIYGKCLNAGQTCVAPDYVLCEENQLDDLVDAFKRHFAALYPKLDSGDFSWIINQRQHTRLLSWLEDAESKGAKVISLAEYTDKKSRLMPLQLLINTEPSMAIMQNEIFGPILPIVTYQSIDQAIDRINQQPRPLALYLFSNDKQIEQKVLTQTHAGGVCINDTVNHVAQEDLPFGGIGPSGMGKYHAKEGFVTFSASKSVMKRGKFYSAKMAFPPYGKKIHQLIYKFIIKR